MDANRGEGGKLETEKKLAGHNTIVSLILKELKKNEDDDNTCTISSRACVWVNIIYI